MNGIECWKMHQLKELIAVDYVDKIEDGLFYETRQTPVDATVTWRQLYCLG